MNYQDIIDFITQNPVCTIATSKDNQPHVRAFLTNIVDDKLYFTTSSKKNVGAEIVLNKKSELCYLNADFSKMLRITTTLEVLDERKLKQYFIDTRDYLKGFNSDDESFILFTLLDSKATLWTLENNMNENSLEVISF